MQAQNQAEGDFLEKKKEWSTKGLSLHTVEIHHHKTCLFCFRRDKMSCRKIEANLMHLTLGTELRRQLFSHRWASSEDQYMKSSK